MIAVNGVQALADRAAARVRRVREVRDAQQLGRRVWPSILGHCRTNRLLPDGTRVVGATGSGGTARLTVGTPDGDRFIVRVAADADARRRLATALAAVNSVRAGTAAAADLVPEVIANGASDGIAWTIERWASGVAATRLMDAEATRDATLRRIGEALGALRQDSAPDRSVDPALAERWVRAPADELRVVATLPADRLDALAAEITGRRLPVGWTHGDLWSGNILLSEETGAVTAIVDWESARPDEAALHDVLHLLLTARRRAARRSFGAEVAVALKDPAGVASWTAVERSLLAAVGVGLDREDPESGAPIRAAVALYWLRQAAANLDRRPELARDRAWIRENVLDVIPWV